MLKKKFGIITLLTVLILALTIPMVRAENESDNSDTENAEVMLVNEDVDEVNSTEEEATANEVTIKKSDVYLAGDDITIDYAVDGNLFVFADSVTITSQIGGDVFVCAKSVTIGENCYIYNNLFAVAEVINVNGVICDLYAAAKTVNISGYVYRDAKVSTNTLNIMGIVGRNAFVSSSNINFSTQEANSNDEQENSTIANVGKIGGDLNYSAKSELEIPEGAVIGNVNFEKITADSSNQTQKTVLSLITFVTTVILIWLIGLWLLPKATKSCHNILINRPLPVIGLGILTPIVLIFAFILGLILNITSSFAFLLLALFFILIGIATSTFIIAINNLLCNKLKIEKMAETFGMLIVSAVVLWLVGLIPYIGSLISFIAVILGIGILVANIVLKNKEAKTKKDITENN